MSAAAWPVTGAPQASPAQTAPVLRFLAAVVTITAPCFGGLPALAGQPLNLLPKVQSPEKKPAASPQPPGANPNPSANGTSGDSGGDSSAQARSMRAATGPVRTGPLPLFPASTRRAAPKRQGKRPPGGVPGLDSLPSLHFKPLPQASANENPQNAFAPPASLPAALETSPQLATGAVQAQAAAGAAPANAAQEPAKAAQQPAANAKKTPAVAQALSRGSGKAKVDPAAAHVEQWVKRYCTSNSQELVQAKLAWQKSQLEKLSESVKSQIQLLDDRIAAYRALRDKETQEREIIRKKVVGIYAAMRPDAAAVQLAEMDEASARTVLSLMEAKQASLVLNEMSTAKAAKLAELLISRKPAKPQE